MIQPVPMAPIAEIDFQASEERVIIVMLVSIK
jgi:hypothetical protein